MQKISSFVKKIDQKKAIIYQLSSVIDGKNAWYILRVESTKHSKFEKCLERGEALELTDYGTVLHSGWGKEPDMATKTELRDKYNISH